MDHERDPGSLTLRRVILAESFTVPAEIAESETCPLPEGVYYTGSELRCSYAVADWLESHKYARVAE